MPWVATPVWREWREASFTTMMLAVSIDADTNLPLANLPRRLSSFVGRERERVQVADALAGTRLLTLTGVGGCGKTSLALEVARDVAGRFPDGIHWVEFAPLTDSTMATAAVAQSVVARPLPGEIELDAAVRRLAPRRALVVLDNCEHLIESCAAIAEALLRGCEGVTVLATSRMPLAIEGEADWRVPSLSLPVDREDVASDAVRLFAARAQLVQPGFSLDRAPVPVVTEICRRLDGIPLAIELAAARIRLLSLAQIARGLDDALALVAGGARTALPRHRTLRASIEWSYELLDDEERLLLQRLGIFRGGFTLETAREVCTDSVLAPSAVLNLLGSLVEQSLVQAEDHGNVKRYRLLETIRQFAIERLEHDGAAGTFRDRHRDTFLAIAERVAAQAVGTPSPSALSEFDLEAPNLSAAFERAVATDGEIAQRLSVALAPWWRARARYAEADDAYARALATPAGSPRSLLRVRVLSARAWVISNSGAQRRAIALGEQALAEAETIDIPAAVIGALLALGNAQVFSDPRGAVQTLIRAREMAAQSDDLWAIARSENLICIAAGYVQDADVHRRYGEGLPARLQQLGDHENLAGYWLLTSYLHHVAGDFALARAAAARTLSGARDLGLYNLQFGALVRGAFEDIATGKGQAARADLRILEARALERDVVVLPWLTATRAWAEAACGRLDEAAGRLEALLENDAGGALDARMSAITLLAEIRLLQADDRAQAVATQGLEIARAAESSWYTARNTIVLGRLAAKRGLWAEAEKLHHEALAAIVERGLRPELPGAFEALAEVACGLEAHTEAARLLGAAERARAELGLVAWEPRRTEIATLADRVHRSLGDGDFESARSEGALLETPDAVAWISRARGARKRPHSGWESLTPTELDIARHVAGGLTNPDIARRMFVSRSTVKTHLVHIYAKLGMTNRAQLAIEAERRLIRGDASGEWRASSTPTG